MVTVIYSQTQQDICDILTPVPSWWRASASPCLGGDGLS